MDFVDAVVDYSLGRRGYYHGHRRDDRERAVRYRERLGIGGWFGTYLSNRQFLLLLTLLCLVILVDAVGNLSVAPVTAALIILMMYLHFEEDVRGKSCLGDDRNDKYSIQPYAILNNFELHRILTGQLLHSNKPHLYVNMTSLSLFLSFEATKSYNQSPKTYLAFMVFLIVATGILHTVIVSKFKRDELYSNFVGFSGVIFALKVYRNCFLLGTSHVAIPIMGDFVMGNLPLDVPSNLVHFVELFIVTILFPQASFCAHISGIAVGYACAFVANIMASTPSNETRSTYRPSYNNENIKLIREACDYDHGCISELMEQKIQKETEATSSWPLWFQSIGAQGFREVLMTVALMLVILVLIKILFQTRSNEDDDIEEIMERRRKQRELGGDKPKSKVQGTDKSVFQQDSLITPPKEETDSTLPRDDDVSGTCDFTTLDTSQEFDDGFHILTTENQDDAVVAQSLATVRTLIVNATKNQNVEDSGEQDRSRVVKLANPKVHRDIRQVHGALELVLSMGFQIEKGKSDNLYLVYPDDYDAVQSWLPTALERIERYETELNAKVKASNEHARQKAREAAIKRMKTNEKKKKEKAAKVSRLNDGRYAAGMGGGDSRTVFYPGGT